MGDLDDYLASLPAGVERSELIPRRRHIAYSHSAGTLRFALG
jgi:hypothetical protein